MKNEDKIVELLSEQLLRQDALVKSMNGTKKEIVGMKEELAKVVAIQERQENHLLKHLEVFSDDVPKFDQVVDIEHLNDGSIILKRHQ